MTKKEAYCCLSCTDLPPCNAAGGNCAECCKDCKDTSKCKGSAFLSKDGNFFLKWNATASLQHLTTYDSFGNDDCIDRFSSYATNYQSTFDSDGKCKIDYVGQNNAGKQCCECKCGENTGGSTAFTTGDRYSRTTVEWIGADTDPNEQSGSCEAQQDRTFEITGPGFECPPFNPKEVEEKEDTEDEYCTGQYNENCNITRVKRTLIAKVFWTSEVKLYDSKGDEVADPGLIIPGVEDPYDPLNPIRVVYAPGCHFFHP